LGKEKLKKIKSDGIKRKLMGVQIEANEISLTGSVNIMSSDGVVIGDLRSACYSPHFKKVIGIAMINEPFCKVSVTGKLEIGSKNMALKVCELPFI
jgi:dimethylsulfoniopropionate demethylase